MTRSQMRERIVATKQAGLDPKEIIIEKILNSRIKDKRSKKSYVLEYLLNRKEEVQTNPNLLTTERVNLDDIWYDLRQNKFVPNKIEITPSTRASVKAYVIELCDLLETTRKDLGIIAQAYATVYFRGTLFDVAIDELDSLKNLGAYVVIIEKEGIVEALKPFADKYGVALVTSHGFLTENATKLSELIGKVGGRVAILTDYDISGILIGLNVPDVHRIGVDLKTLEYFGYNTDTESLEMFEEAYTPVESHKKAVEEKAAKAEVLNTTYSDLLSIKNLAYLSSRRIEINAVKSVVGNERLWEFIMHSLNVIFEDTDYNRAINVFQIAKNVWPAEFLRLYNELAELKARVLEKKRNEYYFKLKGYTIPEHIGDDGHSSTHGEEIGFIEVVKYESEITDDLEDELKKNDELKPILKSVKTVAEDVQNKNQEDKEDEDEDEDE
jgi:hypothetical protein